MTANQGIAIKVGTRVRLVSYNARLNGQEVTLTGINQDAAFPYGIRLDDGTESRVAEREIVGGARAALAVGTRVVVDRCDHDTTSQGKAGVLRKHDKNYALPYLVQLDVASATHGSYVRCEHVSPDNPLTNPLGWHLTSQGWQPVNPAPDPTEQAMASYYAKVTDQAGAAGWSSGWLDTEAWSKHYEKVKAQYPGLAAWLPESQSPCPTPQLNGTLQAVMRDPDCFIAKPIDPLDVEYDGVKLRTLLRNDEKMRTEVDGYRNTAWTSAQRAAVSAHWSAQLRAKVQASAKADAERERNQVVVDMEVE